ncbi:MAG: ATP-binding cassette domain-containing protein [Verrucomicrobiaceae bacterium]|nr:ATP-binding cassette domain-containing protein [Verrucomicrobiaceae bacterium]
MKPSGKKKPSAENAHQEKGDRSSFRLPGSTREKAPCNPSHHDTKPINEKQQHLIDTLDVVDLKHIYNARERALENVSLSANRGEMICIIGPSGCGKSTLIRALAGHLRPTNGHVMINGHNLYKNLSSIQHLISYIPQDNTFDPLLSVEENIDCASAIRCPHMNLTERRKRTDSILVELGLSQCRHRRAGNSQNKLLSGGERKRLNAGLDMISLAEVFLFDEPTSGLSSKDSEHVLEIICDLSRNKITFVSIHQPSSRLFHLFDKALLLDKGGKVAFFGPPEDMLEYFRNANAEEPLTLHAKPTLQGPDDTPRQPDFIFDVLEAPMRDSNGKIVYEQDSRGHFTPARRFSPDFWAKRFREFIQSQKRKEPELYSSGARKPVALPLPLPPKSGFKKSLLHFATHLKRAFLSKLRNRANLITTLLAAPALSTLIATTLRYSEEEVYTFGSASHIPTYLFLTLVVALFLGLTNSAEEIIRDRGMLTRERGHGIRVRQYISGKFITLGAFALVQCIIYLTIGNAILEVRDMFWGYLGWMLITSLTGVAIGLFISSVARDSKTALNIIPLVLIPQIILGGALIKYEEMNRNLHLVSNLREWFSGNQGNPPANTSDLKVPLICELMPLRWAYESLVITQDTRNPLTQAVSEISAEQKSLILKPDQDKDGLADLNPVELEKLDALKEMQAALFSLEADNHHELKKHLEKIKRNLKSGDFKLEQTHHLLRKNRISALDTYQNQGIRDLVANAEIEIEDYRLYEANPERMRPNVFFGQSKTYFGMSMRTLRSNLLALFAFIAISLSTLAVALRRQLKRV